MVASPNHLLQDIRRLVGQPEPSPHTDAVLLGGFVRDRDEAAFTALVDRHGPMVLQVCRRVLGDTHAAEDVYQAVFFVLARKAASLRRPDALAGWLHGVARRLAYKARADDARRRRRETPALLPDVSSTHADPLAELSARELLAILDDELQRLPEVYRVPLILCCLEGRTQEEAARQLGLTPGAVKGRLERGRAKLHARLVRRGLTLPAALLALELSQAAGKAAVPALLCVSTVRGALAAGVPGAGGGASVYATALAEGALRTMGMSKMTIGAILFLAATLVGVGGGALYFAIRPAVPSPTLRPTAGAGQPALQPSARAWSDWGEDSHGLRSRVQVPTEIEQGMPLEARIELSSDPKKLEPGVRQLNTFLAPAFLELVLTNRTSGKRLHVKPHDPTMGMPVDDRGGSGIPLDGTLPGPWQTSFPLVRLGDTLEPGSYDARVQFSFPATPHRWWHGTGAEWDRAGPWRGTVRSGPFRLEVRKETPGTKTFLLPTALRLEPGLQVAYRKEDAEKVTLPVRNGFVVGTRLYRDGQDHQLLGGPPGPDIDQWHDYKKGDKNVTYAIEVFETADAPEHLWHPGPGSGGYKVLWTKTFTLSLTEQEIRKQLAK